MSRHIVVLLFFGLLACGCRGGTTTSSGGNGHSGEEDPPVSSGNGSITNGGGTTDPGDIYDPTRGLSTEREEVRKMDMEALIASLEDDELAPAATDELATRGSESVAPLIKALGDDSQLIRQRAIFTLGRLGELAKEARPELQEIAGDDDNPLQADAKFAIDAIEGK